VGILIESICRFAVAKGVSGQGAFVVHLSRFVTFLARSQGRRYLTSFLFRPNDSFVTLKAFSVVLNLLLIHPDSFPIILNLFLIKLNRFTIILNQFISLSYQILSFSSGSGYNQTEPSLYQTESHRSRFRSFPE
jgi:hypothetical protein